MSFVRFLAVIQLGYVQFNKKDDEFISLYWLDPWDFLTTGYEMEIGSGFLFDNFNKGLLCVFFLLFS